MQEPGSYQKSPAVSHEVGEAALQLAPANPRIAGWLEQAGNEAADAPGPESATVTGSPAHELRPKVRLLSAGAEALSSAELLALLFSAFPGTGEARALELAGRLLSERGGLHGLLRSSVHELVDTAGVGEARAAALLAAAELGKRLVSEPTPQRPVISSPEDVYKLLKARLAHLDRERFVVLILNTKNAVLDIETVSIGTLSSALVHPREVFKPAIRAGAAGVILAHNHPSSNVEPSREDREVTRRIAEAGETLGIDVLDHLIIGDGFFSFKERNLL